MAQKFVDVRLRTTVCDECKNEVPLLNGIMDSCTACGYGLCKACFPKSTWMKRACGYCDHNACNMCYLKTNNPYFRCYDCNNIEEDCDTMLPITWWRKYKDT